VSSSLSARASRHSLALALGVLAIFALHLRVWTFLCDDAYISFRYARNLAEAGLPVYNLDPLERVEGYTNPGWVFALALLARLGIDPASAAPWLCAFGAGASLLLTIGCLRASVATGSAEAGSEAEYFIPALLLSLCPEFVVWGSGGLEGSANLCAGLAACLLAQRGRWRAAGVAAALCLLIRPDAALWLAPPIVIFAWRWWRAEPVAEGVGASEGPLAPLFASFAIVATVLVAHLLWRHHFYGEWLPNTWAVKRHGVDLRATWGTAYLGAWAIGGGFVALLPALFFVRRHSLPWLIATLASLAWAWWVGGDFMAYGRFVLPATTFAALFFGASLIEMRSLVVRRGAPRQLAIGVGVSIALILVWRIPERVQRDHDEAWIDGRWESVDAMHRFAALRVAAGKAWAREWPADTWTSVGAAGAMPYASRFPAFDSYGLVDPAVVDQPGARLEKKARPGHLVHAPMKYVLSREPDLMCHLGHVGPKRPTKSSARRRAGRAWEWACVETGEIRDARAPGGLWPSQYYCCLARKDRERPGGE
jgi:arabinofuranosyltransferase